MKIFSKNKTITKPKIKILDNSDLRTEIYKEFENTDQISLANWSICCTQHIIHCAKVEKIDLSVIKNGFEVNRLWQKGNATVHDVRQAGFKIHSIAKQNKTELAKTVIRAAGQAVAVGHMKEHAMVCSDYAIKTIGLAFPDEKNKITEERKWQLQELKRIKSISL